jgi:hypothetical protein
MNRRKSSISGRRCKADTRMGIYAVPICHRRQSDVESQCEIWRDCRENLLRLRQEFWLTPKNIESIDRALDCVAKLIEVPK